MPGLSSSDHLRRGPRTAIFLAAAGVHTLLLLALISTLGLRQRESEPAVMNVEVVGPFRPPSLPNRRPLSAQPTSSRAAASVSPAPMAIPSAPIAPTRPTDEPSGIPAGVSQALRERLGCSEADILHLSRAERIRCDEELAAGGRDPVAMPLGVDPAKQAAFAAGSWRNREPILARTPHNGCDPNVSEKEFAHGGTARQDWHVGVGCAVSLDKVGRALGFGR